MKQFHAEEAKIILGAAWRPVFIQSYFISLKCYQGSTFSEPLILSSYELQSASDLRHEMSHHRQRTLSNIAEHHGDFPYHMTVDTSTNGLRFHTISKANSLDKAEKDQSRELFYERQQSYGVGGGGAAGYKIYRFK
jgi:hypothetical protein